MSLSRRAARLFQAAALGAGATVAALCLALAALGFLVTGGFLWLARHMDVAAAAAITGAVLLALALIAGFCARAALKRLRGPPPSLLAELGATLDLATSLIGPRVRRDPKKALITALLAGALTEYFLRDKKPGA